jgi:multidrug resistance efflux pump
MANIDDLRIEHSSADEAVSSAPWRSIAVGLLVVILLGAVVIVGFWNSADSERRAATNVAVPTTAAESRDRGNPSDFASVSPGSFTAGGYIEIIPPGPTAVTTRVEGWVRSVQVIEGQSVQAGQVLVTLDDAMHRQALAEADAEVALAQARLDRLRAGFRPQEIAEAEAQQRQAEARVAYARSQVERNAQLAEIGAVPSRQLEAAGADLASAEADAARAQALLELRRAGQRPEDIAVAHAELAQAQTRLERLHWQVQQCVIRAPADGVVLERFVRVGDWIAPGSETPAGRGDGAGRGAGGSGGVMTLFDPTQVQVWVEVNQRDAGRVAVDQPVTLRADALRDRAIHGRVSRIMPMANLQRNTVEVKITLTDAEGDPAVPEGLRPQMSVQVTFLPPQTPQTPRHPPLYPQGAIQP